MRRLGLVAIFTFLFMFLVLPAANAYLDPGSGGMALQFIIAGFAAVAAFFAMFWRKITSFFGRLFGRNKTNV